MTHTAEQEASAPARLHPDWQLAKCGLAHNKSYGTPPFGHSHTWKSCAANFFVLLLHKKARRAIG